MSILSQIPRTMQQILTTTADDAAHQSGFVRRKRKLTGAAFVQTLVFGWLENPDASYDELAQTAGILGIPITRQAIEQRFTADAAETLKTTLSAAAAEVITPDEPQTLPLLEAFKGVYVQDSTSIALPDRFHQTWKGYGCGTTTARARLKLHLRFEVLTGRFQHFHLTDGTTADATAAKAFDPLPTGSLRLADLGYFSLETLSDLTDTGVYWITRLKVGCKLFQQTGEPLCLKTFLKATPHPTIERHIRVGKTKQLPARLIAERVPEAVVNLRRRAIRKKARRSGRTPSAERLHLAGWNIYLTNVEADRLTLKQIRSVAGIRWHIELMFKCFKSVGKVHTSRSQKPYRRLCDVYAKLLVALLRHWVMLATGWRCLQHSLMKTAKLITSYARALTMSFHTRNPSVLHDTLEAMKPALQNGCYVETSATKPATFKRLQAAKKNP